MLNVLYQLKTTTNIIIVYRKPYKTGKIFAIKNIFVKIIKKTGSIANRMSQLKNLNSINAKKPTFPTNPQSPPCTRSATGRRARPSLLSLQKIESPISTIEPISTISHKKIAVAGTQRLPLPLRRSGDDAQRRTFPPPRQAVAAVRSPVFRRPGRRRHAGCTEPVPNRHPGGGGRQSAFDSTLHNITGAYRWHTFCMSGSLYPGTTELVPGLPRDREG